MKRSSLAVLLTLVLAIGTVAPATAQTDDGGILGGFVADDGEDEPFWAPLGDWYLGAENSFQKLQDRVVASIPFFGSDTPANATTYADDVDAILEDNAADIRAYANERVAPRDVDAVRVFFHDRDGGNETRYLVANTSADGWTSGPVLLTESEFNATGKTVDHWLSLDWFASKHADKELATFVEDRVQPDENVSTLRKADLLRKYGGSIKSSAWGDENPGFGGN